jgi:hypothetical protein
MSNDEINIAAYTDSPLCHTGFGRVAEGLVSNMQDRFNWEVYGVNHKSHYTIPDEWRDSVDVHRAWYDGDLFGKKGFVYYLRNTDFDFDVIWMLQDPFILSQQIQVDREQKEFIRFVGEVAEQRNAKVITYFPVDAERPHAEWFMPLFDESDRVVTYTYWARKQILESLKWFRKKYSQYVDGAEQIVEQFDDRNYTDRHIDVIKHGTNPDTFYEMDDQLVKQKRKELYGADDDDFVVGFLGRNQQRKQIPRDVLDGFGYATNNGHPDAKLVLHTQPFTQEGYDLREQTMRMKDRFGVDNDQVFFYRDDGEKVNDETINLFYNSIDCLMLLSQEGWGLPVTEAYTTKTPTIVGDHAALSEVGDSGRSLQVDVPDHPDYNAYFSMDESLRRSEVSLDSFVEKLTKLREMSDFERDYMVDEAYDWAVDNDWQEKANQWSEMFVNVLDDDNDKDIL